MFFKIKMLESIQYILRFLLGESVPVDVVSLVGYTNNAEEYENFKLVIKPSDFFDNEVFGTVNSLPKLPLTIWEETPILFGEGIIENIEDTIILHADLIASTFFLVSRYEELIRNDIRDAHGRFLGKESLPYRGGFIDRPLVEEYGKLLRAILRNAGLDAPEPPKHIQKIFLTHDIDQFTHFRSIRGMIGGVLRGIKRPKEGQKALRSFFGNITNDPWYTFPFLFNQNSLLIKEIGKERCEVIAFFRCTGSKFKEDKPFPNLLHPDYKTLIKYCKRKNVTIGIHASYNAGLHPENIIDEKQKLDRIAKVDAKYCRNHYLDSREPLDMLKLIEAGITDDFTMGYADMAGFRLGTCRPVRFINPKTKELTPLILHGLTVMDSTLSDKRYMYMNAHDALLYCEQLINVVEEFNGELVLLWHNTMVEKIASLYHRQLYRDLIKLLQTK